jgi:hypothetical protein
MESREVDDEMPSMFYLLDFMMAEADRVLTFLNLGHGPWLAFTLAFILSFYSFYT